MCSFNCEVETACRMKRVFKDKRTLNKWRILHNSKCKLCKNSTPIETTYIVPQSNTECFDKMKDIVVDDLSVEELFVAFHSTGDEPPLKKRFGLDGNKINLTD